MIWSAMRTVENRCEITIAILSSVSSRKRSKILTSASASIDAVGSSSTRMSASLAHERRARARSSATGRATARGRRLNHLPSCVSYLSRQRLDERLGEPALGRVVPARRVLVGAVVAGADVLADRELVAHEVLEDDADAAVQRRRSHSRRSRPSSVMRPVGRLVQPRQQLDQRGLARAVLADERELAAGRDVQVDVVERRARASPGT